MFKKKQDEFVLNELDGGRVNKIFREGDVVIRPASSWTPAVHRLLSHLEAVGFDAAPKPISIDEQGTERVSYVAGMVHGALINKEARSENALKSAAQLLRTYHDATESFLTEETKTLPWMFSAREPAKVICHGDFAPYNVVQKGDQVCGIFDFDTAHPAPRIWDVAYAIYRWVPLTGPHNSETFGTLGEKIGRAKRFCDAYRLSTEDRDHLLPMVVTRLNGLIEHMHSQAAAGDETFASHIRAGHDQLYAGDIKFVLSHEAEIHEGIR